MKAKSKKIYALKEIIKRRDLTGLFLRSSMYDSTPWFSISWTVFSISVAAVCHIYNTDNSVFHSLCEYDYFLEFLSVKCVRKKTRKCSHTWEKVANLTYPVFDTCPSGNLWGMMALDMGESFITSRGILTFKNEFL